MGNEVYRAMKTLNFEWKVVNPYHVLVRRKNEVAQHFVKMSLQLYQVDYKSYLLDFKSLHLKDEESNNGEDSITNNAVSTKDNVSSDGFGSPEGHHTMEFFEMCAALITQLHAKRRHSSPQLTWY